MVARRRGHGKAGAFEFGIANRQIHPAEPAGWSGVGAPGNAKLPVGGWQSAIQENGVLGWRR
jgi:hypothetical protein